jgi:hypothetical protein
LEVNDRAAPFREAVERGDHAAILATMAPDVVFRSPVRFHPYVGREAVSRVFRILLDTVDYYELTDELESDEQVGLVFKSLFDDRDVEGIHLLRFDEQGLIREYTRWRARCPASRRCSRCSLRRSGRPRKPPRRSRRDRFRRARARTAGERRPPTR